MAFEHKERIVQEYVPGRQVTMAHLIPNPVDDLYTKLGDTFKKLYGERCEVWLITSDFEAMKHIGLHPSRKIQLFNGSLDCRLLKFELYSGSKKDKFAD